MAIDESLYYDLNKVKSYNKFINMIIGQRSIGKTYAVKREVISRYIKGKGKFVYMRRTGTQIDDLKEPDGEDKFTKDIQKAFPNHELGFKGNKFYCDGEVMGYAIPITKPGSLRGSSYEDVTTIFFDEFISIGTPDDRYRPNEFEDFLNILDTIIRTRDNAKVYMVANPYSLVNPYFTGWGLEVKAGERLSIYQDIIIDFYDSEEFAEARKQTSLGRVMQHTGYGQFSLDNQSIVDSDAFIKERNHSSKFLFNMEYRRFGISVFYDEKTKLYHASKMINKDYKGKIVFEDYMISERTLYCRHYKDYAETMLLQHAFELGLIYYDDLVIKDMCFRIYKKIAIM